MESRQEWIIFAYFPIKLTFYLAAAPMSPLLAPIGLSLFMVVIWPLNLTSFYNLLAYNR